MTHNHGQKKSIGKDTNKSHRCRDQQRRKFLKSYYNCEHLFRGQYESNEEIEGNEKNQMKFLQ